MGVMEIGLQLLDAGETKGEGMKHSAEDRLGRDVGIVAGVGELIEVGTEVQSLVQVGGEGRQRVGFCFNSCNCNKSDATKPLPNFPSFMSYSLASSACGRVVTG